MAAGVDGTRGGGGVGRTDVPGARDSSKHLREVDFVFDGQPLRGLEQNQKTESRRAQLARAGHKVMQFLSAGRYVGNVLEGKETLYEGKKKSSGTAPRRK
jgi:hypothetical protein